MPSPLLAPEGVPVAVTEFVHGGATLIAEDFGTGVRPYVLIHGIGMGRSVYLDFVERLSGRIIALDLPGFGEAPEPVRTLTMERHADLIAAFLRSIKRFGRRDHRPLDGQPDRRGVGGAAS
ncbi:alpha/beta fold hydrolase [Microbacterium sp. CH12i]|uniref:alpha/beta fold hydrolase n=1 Tax=Microbacterium sp. CH12i TaxID=1479651 RepID=UPI000B312986